MNPYRFDVLLMENLYGDILSELCSGLVGGVAVVPGANLGDDIAVFEAVHGSAPDRAGTGTANPLGVIAQQAVRSGARHARVWSSVTVSTRNVGRRWRPCPNHLMSIFILRRK
jgi:isocitrate dehydrogenase